MPEKRGRILVIRGGAIGDFILTLPAIAALRSTFPGTHLELVGYPRVAELARAANIIDAFRSIEARPLARFFARNGQLDKEWSDFFESFDLIISYLYDPDQIFQQNVGRASKAQFIQAPYRPTEDEPVHASAVFLKPLERLAIFDADPAPRIVLSGGERLQGQWLAAHPGSGSEKKNWPAEKWEQLLSRVLAETNANVLLVGGEAEYGRIQELGANFESSRVRLALNLPLSELGSLIASSAAFIGHDSGITHLAAALGASAIVLWGPSNETIWRPVNSSVKILHGVPDLGIDPVWQALAGRLHGAR